MQVLVTALTQGGNKGVEEKIQGEIKLKQVCFCLLQSALLFNYYILAPKLGFTDQIRFLKIISRHSAPSWESFLKQKGNVWGL